MKNHEIHMVLNRIYKYSNFEERRATPYTPAHYHLNNIRSILAQVGNPQNSFRSIHIAGTKGKGSATFFTAGILKELGYHTGYTVSPQLVDERDRFFVDGKKSSWDEIIPVFDEVVQAVEKASINPTVFDIFTAVAFLWFRKYKVEMAVIETGLGGRLDSTNILSSDNLLACLITSIGFDHMDKLGTTLAQIAREKAGIIKKNIPIFTYNRGSDVLKVIQERAEHLAAPFYQINTLHPLLIESIEEVKLEQVENDFFITPANEANLNLVVTSLINLGYVLSAKTIKSVLKKLPFSGRYQKHKNILLDSAHTPESISHLVNAVRSDPKTKQFKEIRVFFYALYDKDIKGMIAHIPSDWELIFFDCELHFIKPERVQEVKQKLDEARGQVVKKIGTIEEINLDNYPQVLHIFCGSFKLVGKVLSFLEQSQVNLEINKACNT